MRFHQRKQKHNIKVSGTNTLFGSTGKRWIPLKKGNFLSGQFISPHPLE
jgi:hypothetical protein